MAAKLTVTKPDAANLEIPAAEVPEIEEPTKGLPSTEFDPVEAEKY